MIRVHVPVLPAALVHVRQSLHQRANRADHPAVGQRSGVPRYLRKEFSAARIDRRCQQTVALVHIVDPRGVRVVEAAEECHVALDRLVNTALSQSAGEVHLEQPLRLEVEVVRDPQWRQRGPQAALQDEAVRQDLAFLKSGVHDTVAF